MATNSSYSVLYDINLLINAGSNKIQIDNSDIVSIAFIHNYDHAMYPIIRIRIYSDISMIQNISEYPDNIKVSLSYNGILYKINDDEKTMLNGVVYKTLDLKGYIENKNIPTSLVDQYRSGIKKDGSLNDDVKVPFELFCYDERIIHFMQQKVDSIFKNMSISSVINTMFRKQGSIKVRYNNMITNQTKYDQILFPNLNMSEAITFLDTKYGLYKKGAQIYGEDGILYIADTDVNTEKPIAIFVESYKSSSDNNGVRVSGTLIDGLNTKAENVSVITQSDVERVLNADTVAAVNVNTLNIETTSMSKLYNEVDTESTLRVNKDTINMVLEKIHTPDIIHKSLSNYVASTYNARVTERITRVDVSGSGFPMIMDISSRFNLVFDSPIRGMNINQSYRPMNIVHVLTNVDGDKFTCQTTMSLCSN